MSTLYASSNAAEGRLDAARPSRLPRDPLPLGADGRPATRWTDPRTAAAYALRDGSYDRAVAWPALIAAVAPREPRRVSGRPDGEVLDLGCGLAAIGHFLANEHWLRVHAVDISPTMHRLGAKRYRDAWLLRSTPDRGGRLQLRRGQCTVAIVKLLLVHLSHPCLIVGALSEARRVLRPGSTLAAIEPGPGTYGHLAGEVQWGESDSDSPDEGSPYVARYLLGDGTDLPVTAWHYSPDTLADCLRTAGFRLDEIRPLHAPGEAGGAPLWLYRATAVTPYVTVSYDTVT
ncbi:MAG TPA: class I SAM-dependent methyltransferase [Actinocrinis sp.]|nr:class I SAM-dependent methyltransferase [Actinocrinis sp.]